MGCSPIAVLGAKYPISTATTPQARHRHAQPVRRSKKRPRSTSALPTELRKVALPIGLEPTTSRFTDDEIDDYGVRLTGASKRRARLLPLRGMHLPKVRSNRSLRRGRGVIAPDAESVNALASSWCRQAAHGESRAIKSDGAADRTADDVGKKQDIERIPETRMLLKK